MAYEYWTLYLIVMQDENDVAIDVGVASYGLVVFQNKIRINAYGWANVMKISFKRKQFYVQLRANVSRFNDMLLYIYYPKIVTVPIIRVFTIIAGWCWRSLPRIYAQLHPLM